MGVPEALTEDLHSGAVALPDVAQTLLLQLPDLRDLVCTAVQSRAKLSVLPVKTGSSTDGISWRIMELLRISEDI